MALLQQHYEKHTNGTAVTTANSDDFGDDRSTPEWSMA
jgi:hypothetical protein